MEVGRSSVGRGVEVEDDVGDEVGDEDDLMRGVGRPPRLSTLNYRNIVVET